MNTQNLNYLKDQLKYLGFGDSLNAPLETQIEKQTPNFSLKFESNTKTVQGNTAKFELYFNKSDKSDMYFFNNYKTQLIDNNGNLARENTFQVDRTKSITAKEAINLLEGRAVKTSFNFNGEDAEVFVKLDFDNKSEKGNYRYQFYNQNYGVDTKQILEKSHLVFTGEKESENLEKSLEKGNLVQSKFMVKGQETTGYIALNPQYKTLDYFTEDLKPVYTKNLGEGQAQEKKPEQAMEEEATVSVGRKR